MNGLTTTHFTTHQTVGDLLNELYSNQEEIISVFPAREKELASQDTIFIKLQPVVTNKTIAANMHKAIEKASQPQPKSPTYKGTATWYRFGKKLTAASTQFPKGTKLRVVAVNSGKIVDVVINDYGPEAWTGVAIDLNSIAFAKLAPLGAGKIPIKYYQI